MGHHFVPQYYLRRFAAEDAPELIWMYDKKQQRYAKPAIAKAAQQAAFYDSDVEKQLNETVERPANRVFDKLAAGEPIGDSERVAAAVYIGTMYSRVPTRRGEIAKLVPNAAEVVLRDVESAILEWSRKGADESAVARRLQELEIVAESIRADPLRGSVVDLIRSPFPSERVVQAIAAMTWRIGKARPPSFFVTGDNPVHFFKALGLRNSRSELTFPISRDTALFASWRGDAGMTLFFDSPAALVKECNRRIAHGSERFLFSPRAEPWLPVIAHKERPFFSEILW